MKTWKRVLSLTLATTLSASLLAGVASADFEDVPVTHEYESAVSLLTSLGVIKGFDDGTFKPDLEITREQFTKILYSIMTGSDNADMYRGQSPFPDVDEERWSAPYINWAKNLGIVHGDDTGDFSPERNVTFAEASKMFVTAIGYDAKNYSFPYGFIDKAQSTGLFEDVVAPSANEYATRGEISQMGENAIFTEAPRFSVTNGTLVTFQTPAQKVFEIVDEKVTLEATSSNALNRTAFNNENQISLNDGTSEIVFDYNENVDEFLGQEVNVYYKDETKNGLSQDDEIINVSSVAQNSVYTVPAGAVSTSKTNSSKVVFTIDGREYSIDYSAATAVNMEDGSALTLSESIFEVRSGDSFQIVDQNGDGAAERIYKIDSVDTHVNYYDANKETIMLAKELTSITEMKDEDGNVIVSAYEGIAKDDNVNITASMQFVGDSIVKTYTIGETSVISGAKLTSVNGSTFYFDGEVMNYIPTVAVNSSVGGSTSNTVAGNLPSFKVGSTYDLYLDANGNIYKALLSNVTTISNEILVTDVSQVADGLGGISQMTITGTLADGTVKTMTVKLPSSHATVTNGADDHEVFDRVKGWADINGLYSTDAGFDGQNIAAVNNLFKYTANSEGEITALNAVSAIAGTGDTAVEVTDAATDAYTNVSHDQDFQSLYDSANNRIGFIENETLVYIVNTSTGAVSIVKGSDLPEFVGADNVNMVEAVIDGALGRGSITKLVISKAGALVAAGDSENMLVTDITVTAGDTDGEVIFKLDVLRDGVETTIETGSIASTDAIWTNASGNTVSLETAMSNAGAVNSTMMGYVNVTFDGNGKIDSIKSLQKDAAIANVGDAAWDQGIIADILKNGLAVHGTFTMNYNTNPTADTIASVDNAQDVLVFADDVKFYTIDGTPTGGDVVSSGYVAGDAVKIGNSVAAVPTTIDVLIESTNIGQSGGIHFFVDYVLENTRDGVRVTEVYFYTNPVEMN